MRKLFLLTIIFSLTFLTGCNKNDNKSENIFSSINSRLYSNNLTLEDGLEIILPTVKNWADDAILQKLMTNVIVNQNEFKANVYEFESVKKRKTLSVTYNYKHPIDEKTFSGFGSPESWELSNRFNFQEVNWPTDTSEETLKEVNKDLGQSKYNDIDNYLKSEKIIDLAKKEGLSDFINKYKKIPVIRNNIWLFETSKDNKIEWVVDYSVFDGSDKQTSHIFLARFDPITGELIKKTIR